MADFNGRTWEGDPRAWVKTDSGNLVLEGLGFFVSYAETPEGPETALIHLGDVHIIPGDHRDAYGDLIDDGYAACRRYYDAVLGHGAA